MTEVLRRSRLLMKLMAVLAVFVLVASACGGSDDEGALEVTSSTTTSAPSTTVPAPAATVATSPPTTGAAAFSADDAFSVTDAYFDAFNAGDVDAVFSLFTEDVTFDWFGRRSRADFEMINWFYVGQGTRLTSPECSVNHEVPEEATVHVFCEFETIDSLIPAVGAPAVPTRFTAVISPEGVRRFTFSYLPGQDFLHVGAPFNRWLDQNHPGIREATSFRKWTTVDEAREIGALQAEYAQKWAVYLDENGCGYLEGC